MLDFGSGFGLVANHLAQDNVLAVEPKEMVLCGPGPSYQQLVGSMDQLASLKEASFEVILYHNVLGMSRIARRFSREFTRLLKQVACLYRQAQ
ncbi:MAG: methyltransferase domain-containing protein [Streptococcus sp.]